MNTTFPRAAAALCVVCMWLPTSARANELLFSDMESRLSAVEQKLAQQERVQTASYVMTDHNGEHAAGSGNGAGYCCDDACGACDSRSTPCSRWFAEIQFLWLRPHISEVLAGRETSERHYFAPRAIMGYEDGCGAGARVRYFHWGNTVGVLGGDDFRLDWDVVDIEATGRLKWRATDVLFAGGFRYADVGFDTRNAAVDAELYGLTFAIDARTQLCCTCNRTWSTVYGTRLSVLGGDWETARSTVSGDDNVLVRELYLGIEYQCCYCGYDLFTRAVYEMQNWHSDFLAQDVGTDSIGLIGPGFHVGVAY